MTEQIEIEEVVHPRRVNVEIGKRYRVCMPASEVMMHMKLVDEFLFVEIRGDAAYLFNEDGPVTFPVLPSEAGILQDDLGYYFYEEV